MGGKRLPLNVKLWKSVRITPGCWEWTDYRLPFGYGRIYDGATRRMLLTHRVSYELHHGPIPDGLIVRHTCDNPPCVNPDHLELGTRVDNMQDCVQRGRNFFSRKTHCKRGHEFNEENTYYRRTGGRMCKVCGPWSHGAKAINRVDERGVS